MTTISKLFTVISFSVAAICFGIVTGAVQLPTNPDADGHGQGVSKSTPVAQVTFTVEYVPVKKVSAPAVKITPKRTNTVTLVEDLSTSIGSGKVTYVGPAPARWTTERVYL